MLGNDMRLNLWCAVVLTIFSVLASGGFATGDEKRTDKTDQPHVVFVTGDDEYRSEVTMPMIARILEAKHGMRTSVAYARPTPQSKENIEGLEALRTADLAVFYMRYRKLPDDQLQLILDYVNSGKPMIGLRTTTHGFLYPADHKHAAQNDGFGRDVFGQKWLYHNGHSSSTDVSVIPEQADHPILRGVAEEFTVRSWLYQVLPLNGNCTPLLMGKAVNSERKDPEPNPVAWTKDYKGAKVFFTTLGHPDDFKVESVRKLLVNAIYWALEKEVPKEGANAEVQGTYEAPPTT